jgi:hypothetical protein
MRFNVKAMALTAAIFCGGAVLLVTWWLIILGHGGTEFILSRAYPGYAVTPLGSLIGLVWGFVDGLICGAIFAWLYNLFAPKEAA